MLKNNLKKILVAPLVLLSCSTLAEMVSVTAQNDYNDAGLATEIEVIVDGVSQGILSFNELNDTYTIQSLEVVEGGQVLRLRVVQDWNLPGPPWLDEWDLNAYIDLVNWGGRVYQGEAFVRTGRDDADGNLLEQAGVDAIDYSIEVEGDVATMWNQDDWLEFDRINHDPVADAGDNQTVEVSNSSGASVTLDGSASNDVDNNLLTYTWFENNIVIAQSSDSPFVNLILAPGVHVFQLVVEDNLGGISNDHVTVSIVDTTPPNTEIEVGGSNVWPPNHKMVMAAQISASDVYDPNIIIEVNVTSNEAINGPGDGNTDSDWRFDAQTGEVFLRAERSGSGTGRIYTIRVTSTDSFGNASEATTEILVPHNQ